MFRDFMIYSYNGCVPIHFHRRIWNNFFNCCRCAHVRSSEGICEPSSRSSILFSKIQGPCSKYTGHIPIQQGALNYLKCALWVSLRTGKNEGCHFLLQCTQFGFISKILKMQLAMSSYEFGELHLFLSFLFFQPRNCDFQCLL